MKLTIGFSPCPNDTFIFDALVNKEIAYDGIEFEPYLEDIQTLNEWAKKGKLDITKLSFPAFFDNLDTYRSLPAGSALGKGVGPLLVAKRDISLSEVENRTIAIPGENTTANFLLSFAFPNAQNRIPTLFSGIEEAVVKGDADLGVIIHENRFTYQQKGLIKIMDLGEHWEQQQNLPIPLACIAIKREFDTGIRNKVAEIIRASLQHSFSNYPSISAYTKNHAQAMDEEVMRKHIELYVNNYTMELGEPGTHAIKELYKIYNHQRQTAPVPSLNLFQ